MSSSSSDNIVIKLEIQIPSNGGQPTVHFGSPPAKRVDIPIDTDVVLEPAGGATMTKWDGAAGGAICVRATPNNPSATEVWAKVFPPNNSIPTPPLTSPPAGASQISFNASAGEYQHPALPGVIGYPSVLQHTLVAWEKVGPYLNQNDLIPFSPIWGPYTECDYPFSTMLKKKKVCCAPLTFEMLPVRWGLVAKSFAGGALARLNGTWSLKLAAAPNQQVLYCNGGDGVSVPRIQMTCESPFAEAWQLRFEIGSSRVTYYLPANQFQQQRENRFSQAISEVAEEESSIPASIAVRPL